ncbi:hypothetical protein MRX96_049236 [Rhipicephalus microplus]
MATFGRVEEPDREEPWSSYTERLDAFFNANDIEDDGKKKWIFLGVQKWLLVEKNLTLNKAVEVARTAEAAELNASKLRKGNSDRPASRFQEGLAIHLKFKKRHVHAPKDHKAQKLNLIGKPEARHHEKFKPCICCGCRDHKPPECQHINTWRYKCDKVGHLAGCCLSSADMREQPRGSQVNTVQSADEPPEYYLHSLRTQSSMKPITLTLIINGVPLEMELDSGFPVPIFS